MSPPPPDALVAPLAPRDVSEQLAGLLHGGGLHCVYQPLVDLDCGAVLGHEALLRGPAGTRWAAPMVLLAAAHETGRLIELEQYSLRTSLADAARMAAGRPVTLFVNLEPSTLTRHSDAVLEVLSERASTVQVVVEITERAMAADPAGVLAGAERLRAAGCAIALDDIGVEPASLAFIPVLRPEVVKLDLGLLRSVQDPATIMVAGAVRAYAEESGAEVVAEGIESPKDLTRALVLGATLGQGWWWGRPDRIARPADFAPARFVARPVGPLTRTTPVDLVGSRRRMRRASKDLLLPVSHTLELAAMQARVPPLLLACFEHARFFTPATSRRYTEMAARLPFVGAFGKLLARSPAPGVRGTALSPRDPLAHEWTVVVLGAHEAAALIARDLGDTGPDGDRQFDFVVTHDHALVTAAAQALIARMTPG